MCLRLGDSVGGNDGGYKIDGGEGWVRQCCLRLEGRKRDHDMSDKSYVVGLTRNFYLRFSTVRRQCYQECRVCNPDRGRDGVGQRRRE